jgi:peptidoglycan LD-endopeptidase LytH
MGFPPGLKRGQKVSKGQLIRFAGDTGYGKERTNGKFAAHLHFGMYAANGKAMGSISLFTLMGNSTINKI